MFTNHPNDPIKDGTRSSTIVYITIRFMFTNHPNGPVKDGARSSAFVYITIRFMT